MLTKLEAETLINDTTKDLIDEIPGLNEEDVKRIITLNVNKFC